MWIKTGRPNPPFIFQLVPRLQLDKLKSRCRRQPNLMYRNFNAVTKCRGVPACPPVYDVRQPDKAVLAGTGTYPPVPIRAGYYTPLHNDRKLPKA